MPTITAVTAAPAVPQRESDVLVFLKPVMARDDERAPPIDVVRRVIYEIWEVSSDRKVPTSTRAVSELDVDVLSVLARIVELSDVPAVITTVAKCIFSMHPSQSS